MAREAEPPMTRYQLASAIYVRMLIAGEHDPESTAREALRLADVFLGALPAPEPAHHPQCGSQQCAPSCPHFVPAEVA